MSELFRMQRKRLGANQQQTLDKVVADLKQSPEIGLRNKGDLQEIYTFSAYVNDLGEVLLGYCLDQDRLRLLSMTLLTIR